MKLLTAILFFISLNTFGQNSYSGDSTSKLVYVLVEHMPEFPGGQDGMIKYLQSNIKSPKNFTAGRVLVEFVVSYTGKVENVRVADGTTIDMNNEAVRVIKNMPKWKPGMQSGKSVNVSYKIPINFQ